MSNFYNNSIFWIETEKIKPNPFQPRRDFDQEQLNSLADSIRMYGVLQPLVVTRVEYTKDDGGLAVQYELISGERRLRASKLAGITQVPVIIRSNTDDSKTKLELAIIENLQREDLNPVDRARAFRRLVDEFSFKHNEIGTKVGKSREYVSNTLRILSLPEEMLNALSTGKISEGHTRPLLMLADRKDEQTTLFKEIIYKNISVRDTELIARKIAFERARKKDRMFDPGLVAIEEQMAQSLGTRVHIEKGENGGKIFIDFFSDEDLKAILMLVQASGIRRQPNEMLSRFLASKETGEPTASSEGEAAPVVGEEISKPASGEAVVVIAPVSTSVPEQPAAQNSQPENNGDDDIYSVRNFSI